jgi:hypothetical protein
MRQHGAALFALDAACRLGLRPVALAAWHRWGPGRLLARRRLAHPAALAAGAVLPGGPAPPAPAVPPAHRRAVLARAALIAPPAAGWQGGFPAAVPALDAAAGAAALGDIRPVWERSRWAELPLLAQAARLDPGGGHAERAAALLTDWLAANPAFRGPNWACGQEAALRALHLGLAIGLLDAAPTPAARALFRLHGQRIAATPAYALAQDNTHTVSEPAGLLICGLLGAEPAWVRRGARALDAALLRLVAPCGAFAAASTGYHRLLLDVLAVQAWLRAQHGGPAMAPAAAARAAAAVRWLWRLTEAATGRVPRLGHQDGSVFADLALAGPQDARPSVARAARLYAAGGTGFAADPGCTWLGLAEPAAAPPWPAVAHWTSDGFTGWQAGSARAVLRTGAPRLRFRPGQADLLHLDLWEAGRPIAADGGSGSYNAPPGEPWWHAHFTGTAAHNTIAFDGHDQMPRAGRFLFARWPRTGLLPDGAGAWYVDARGNRHARRVSQAADGRRWVVEDRVGGPFRSLALRWRLPRDEAWALTPGGAAGDGWCLAIAADAPLRLEVEAGWESPDYGLVEASPMLRVAAHAPVSRLTSTFVLARDTAPGAWLQPPPERSTVPRGGLG